MFTNSQQKDTAGRQHSRACPTNQWTLLALQSWAGSAFFHCRDPGKVQLKAGRQRAGVFSPHRRLCMAPGQAVALVDIKSMLVKLSLCNCCVITEGEG